jgi:hypothetical protein
VSCPIGVVGQSPSTVHVGTQSFPRGVDAHVHPCDPGGHAPMPAQSESIAHDRGPIIMPAPSSPGGVASMPMSVDSEVSSQPHTTSPDMRTSHSQRTRMWPPCLL